MLSASSRARPKAIYIWRLHTRREKRAEGARLLESTGVVTGTVEDSEVTGEHGNSEGGRHLSHSHRSCN